MAPRARTRRFRAVLFDVGGTLLDDRDYAGYASLADRLGIPVDEEALASADRAVTAECDACGAWPPAAERWARTVARARDGATDPVIAERFGRELSELPPVAHVFSDVRRTLVRLTEEGRRLGAVSNATSEERLRDLLDGAGILQYFGPTVAAGSEGLWKPDPALFRRAAERAGVAPAEAFYVGDLAHTDAKGAAAAGLGAVWLNRDGTGFGEDPPEITSLSELPRWIARVESVRVI